MQLWQLGLLVAGGISLIVYLVHAAGGSGKAVLVDDAAARARFAEDYPNEKPLSVHFTKNRDAAFLALKGNSVGLLHPIGDCFLTRILGAADIIGIAPAAARLTLTVADFTFKGGTYEFANEDQRQSVQALLENAKRQSAGAHNA